MQVYKFFTENFHDMGCGFLGEYDDKKRTVLRPVRFFKSYSRSFRQQKFFRCLHHSLQCTIQLFLPQTGHSPVHSHGTQCTVVCITAQKMYPFFLDPAEHLMPPDGIFAKQCAAAELFIYRQCHYAVPRLSAPETAISFYVCQNDCNFVPVKNQYALFHDEQRLF